MATRSKKISKAPAALPAPEPFALISNAKLLQLYSTMLKCRILHERARTLSNSAIPPGQEASTVGVALDLLPKDSVVHSSADIAPSFVKGVPLHRILAGLNSPRNDDSVTAQIHRAIALIQTSKGKKNSRIVAVFLSVDSTSLPPCKPALQLAAALSMPILFVCRNPLPQDDIAGKINPFGFPGIAIDGNDVVAVYRVASEAITHARKGNGPTFLECKSVPATTSARSKPAHDPILNMENYLTRKGLFNPHHKQNVIAEFNLELDAAHPPATSSLNP
jgi:TPP-dependent pyruvate/acetoin dehydrogenase alpha subunit